jgi:hypothetical protein
MNCFRAITHKAYTTSMPDSVSLANSVIAGLHEPRAHGGSKIAEAMSASLAYPHHFKSGNLSTDFQSSQHQSANTLFNVFNLNPQAHRI